MKLARNVKSVALALALAAGLAAAPLSQAEAAWHGGHGGGGWHGGGGYHHGGGGYGRGGAFVGGLLAGSLVTAALVDRPRYYYGGPSYYPAYYPRRTVVYADPYYAPAPPAYYYGY